VVGSAGVVLVGAGLYRLSPLPALLISSGATQRTICSAMEFRRARMPKGMLLTSEGFAFILADPSRTEELPCNKTKGQRKELLNVDPGTSARRCGPAQTGGLLLADRDDGQRMPRERGRRARASGSCSDDLCFSDDDVRRPRRPSPVRDHGRRSVIATRAANGLRLRALFMSELLP
jgi:hypothetical protein